MICGWLAWSITPKSASWGAAICRLSSRPVWRNSTWCWSLRLPRPSSSHCAPPEAATAAITRLRNSTWNSAGWMSDSASSAISATSLRIWFLVCSSTPGSISSSGIWGVPEVVLRPLESIASGRHGRSSPCPDPPMVASRARFKHKGTAIRRTFPPNLQNPRALFSPRDLAPPGSGLNGPPDSSRPCPRLRPAARSPTHADRPPVGLVDAAGTRRRRQHRQVDPCHDPMQLALLSRPYPAPIPPSPASIVPSGPPTRGGVRGPVIGCVASASALFALRWTYPTRSEVLEPDAAHPRRHAGRVRLRPTWIGLDQLRTGMDRPSPS